MEPVNKAEEESFNAVTIFFIQLCVCVLAGHYAHRTKFKHATEGSIALMIGMVTGGLVFCYVTYIAKTPLSLVFSFRTDVFFNVLIPPIIFNAGFSVKKKFFFANFVTLVLFGVLGTFLSVAIVAAGCKVLLHWQGLEGGKGTGDVIALGTILSSTDSVAALQVLKAEQFPVLHSLVFGEGVVNDATSLVIFRALDTLSKKSTTIEGATMFLLEFCYLFAASLLLGVLVGMLSALIIRHAFGSKGSHSTDSEALVTFLMAFSAYSIAEGCDLSGIFAVFFCGVAMSHWTWHSLSASAKVVTVYLFRLLSFGMELFMFVYAGFDLLSMTVTAGGTDGSLVLKALPLALCMLLLLMSARAIFLCVLTLVANLWRSKRVGWREVVAMWWAGSIRGAISVAMTYHHLQQKPGHRLSVKHQMLETALILVVLITTLGLGSLTKQFFSILLPAGTVDYSLHQDSLRSMSSHQWGPPGAPQKGSQDIQHWWRKWDRRYLQPLLGGRNVVKTNEGQLSPRGNLLSTAFRFAEPSQVTVRSHPAVSDLINLADPASSLAALDKAQAEVFGAALGALDSLQLDASLDQLAWLVSHVAHSDSSNTGVQRSIHQINQFTDRVLQGQVDATNRAQLSNGTAYTPPVDPT